MTIANLTETRSHRLKRIEVTPKLILLLLKVPDDGLIVNGMSIRFATDPIPLDAKALRCGINSFGNIEIVVEDESFGCISEGMEIPYLRPVYETTT